MTAEEQLGGYVPLESEHEKKHRRSAKSWWFDRLTTDGLVLVALVAWYIGSLHLPEYVLPDPFAVGYKVYELLGGDPSLAVNTLDTAIRVFLAVIIALILGTALVVVARYIPFANGFLIHRLMPFLNAMPALGWAIMGLFWFGISSGGVVFVEVAILVPFVMINVWEGLKGLDSELMEMTQSFTRNRTKTFGLVVTPLLLPYFFAAARISFGTAWKVALFAEIFSAPSGLGYLINLAQQLSDSVTVFAAVIVIVIFVFLFERLVFDNLEKRLFRHRDTETP